jgi:hypothetical protein
VKVRWRSGGTTPFAACFMLVPCLATYSSKTPFTTRHACQYLWSISIEVLVAFWRCPMPAETRKGFIHINNCCTWWNLFFIRMLWSVTVRANVSHKSAPKYYEQFQYFFVLAIIRILSLKMANYCTAKRTSRHTLNPRRRNYHQHDQPHKNIIPIRSTLDCHWYWFSEHFGSFPLSITDTVYLQ